MLGELKTKRRWILSILEAAADQPEGRLVARASVTLTCRQRLDSKSAGKALQTKSPSQDQLGLVR